MNRPAPPLPAPDWALFLDLDGTLAPLRPHPDDVRVDDATRRALAALAARLDGALCVASGRPRHELQRLLAGLPGAVLVGCHGGEGLDADGAAMLSPEQVQSRATLARARAALVPVVWSCAGTWIEDKGSAFAVHFRGNPQAGPALRHAADAVAAAEPALRLLAGDAVLEFLPAGVSKGRVIERLMERVPFAGRVPVAIGDDVTDEDAFAAATAGGGFGVLVGAREPSAARHAFADPAAVAAWLQHAAASLPVPAAPAS